MAITMYSPFRELDMLRREVERAFESFGPETAWPVFRAPFMTRANIFPLLNLSEDKENMYIQALAPGLKGDTLEITVTDNVLRIAGEKEWYTAKVEPEAYHRREREGGKFVRAITLPADVAMDKVKAEYKEGVLLITLPKAEAAKPKQISVKVQ